MCNYNTNCRKGFEISQRLRCVLFYPLFLLDLNYVALLARHIADIITLFNESRAYVTFDYCNSLFACSSLYNPPSSEEEEEEFICQVYNNNNNNRKKDTLTGCQGGYTPINAGRL